MSGDKHFAVMIAGMVQPGMEEYTKQYLTNLMQFSREHDGCLTYNIHQSVTNSREFMMYSAWKNREAFEKHNSHPEIQEFKKQLVKNMFDVESPKTFWNVLED